MARKRLIPDGEAFLRPSGADLMREIIDADRVRHGRGPITEIDTTVGADADSQAIEAPGLEAPAAVAAADLADASQSRIGRTADQPEPGGIVWPGLPSGTPAPVFLIREESLSTYLAGNTDRQIDVEIDRLSYKDVSMPDSVVSPESAPLASPSHTGQLPDRTLDLTAQQPDRTPSLTAQQPANSSRQQARELAETAMVTSGLKIPVGLDEWMEEVVHAHRKDRPPVRKQDILRRGLMLVYEEIMGNDGRFVHDWPGDTR